MIHLLSNPQLLYKAQSTLYFCYYCYYHYYYCTALQILYIVYYKGSLEGHAKPLYPYLPSFSSLLSPCRFSLLAGSKHGLAVLPAFPTPIPALVPTLVRRGKQYVTLTAAAAAAVVVVVPVVEGVGGVVVLLLLLLLLPLLIIMTV